MTDGIEPDKPLHCDRSLPCAVCEQDGEESEVVGCYQAEDGTVYNACETHIKLANEAKCNITLYKGYEDLLDED